MTTRETMPTENSKIFSSGRVRDYLMVIAGIGVIALLYHLFLGGLSFQIGTQSPPGTALPNRMQMPGTPGTPGMPATGAPTGQGGYFNAWPLWATFSIPTVSEIMLAAGIAVAAISALFVLYKRDKLSSHLGIIIVVGALCLLVTNLIHGWQVGILDPIGSASEILQDALKITSPLEFISNYSSIQPTLSLHALTQPPGAVLVIYLFYVLTGSAAAVSITLALSTAVISAIALRGIYSKFFEKELSNLGVFIYLFLPAVQVYYLANIYAVVATVAILAVYCYLHDNRIVSIVGTLAFSFIGTLISFLFVVIPLALLIYEILTSMSEGIRGFDSLRNVLKPVGLIAGVVLLYGVAYVALGFNYAQAFSVASASENPGGFMLLANPVEYFTSRIEDVLDITVFYGPVLAVLGFRGLQQLRSNPGTPSNKKAYLMAIAAIIALGLLFLTGTPKKGETARICMFILPFLLLPVLSFVESAGYSKWDRFLLLVVVVLQAILMQLVGTYIW